MTVAAGIRPLYPRVSHILLKDFTYQCHEILDFPHQSIIPYIPLCVEFIWSAINQGGRVLVHCFAGVSWSASMVIAYLMTEMGMSFAEAFSFVKQKWIVIFPNFGFVKQL